MPKLVVLSSTYGTSTFRSFVPHDDPGPDTVPGPPLQLGLLKTRRAAGGDLETKISKNIDKFKTARRFYQKPRIQIS